jgi:DNA-binding response OmpR family regulator
MKNGTNPGTILCVHHDAFALARQKAELGKAGYKVFTARSAEEALVILATEEIDLVMLGNELLCCCPDDDGLLRQFLPVKPLLD